MKRLNTLFLGVLLSISAAYGTGVVDTRSQKPTYQKLQKAIHEDIAPHLKSAQWGLHVIALDNGEVLFSEGAQKSLVPASTIKFVTASAALSYLGPEYRIETALYSQVRPNKQGKLEGDLILYGQGDPSLLSYKTEAGNPSLEDLVDQIVARGIREIEGDLVADETFFQTPQLGKGWEWEDMTYYYTPEISALSVDSNILSFRIEAGSEPRAPARVTPLQKADFVKVINSAITVTEGSDKKIDAIRPLGHSEIRIAGTIPVGWEPLERRVSIHNPAKVSLQYVAEMLKARGIHLHGKLRVIQADSRSKIIPNNFKQESSDYRDYEKLASVDSLPLKDILEPIFQKSCNFTAELLYAHLNAACAKRGIEDPLDKLLTACKMDPKTMTVADGSGLSRYNLAQSQGLAEWLGKFATHPHFQYIENQLLKGESHGFSEKLGIKLKTGGMTYVKSSAGYMQTAAGRPIAFSLIINNYQKGPEDPSLSEMFEPALIKIFQLNSSTDSI